MPTIKHTARSPVSSPRNIRAPVRSATGTDLEQANTLHRRGPATPSSPPFGAHNAITGAEQWTDGQGPYQSPTGIGASGLRFQEPEGAVELNTVPSSDTEDATPDENDHERHRDLPSPPSTDVYTPIECPEGFEKLDFRPVILKRGVTIGLAILYLTIIAGIVTLTYCGDSSSNYAVVNPNIYFGARFGPAIVGTVTTVLVRSFLQEVCRMLPYINMADPGPGVFGSSLARDSVAALYFPTLGTNTGEGVALVLLQFVTTPLIALKIGLVEILEGTDGWTVIVHPLISHILIAYYAIQILALGFVTIWLWNRQTGVRSDWDPTSLADIIALFQHFHVNSQLFSVPASMPARLIPFRGFRFRLGYWMRRPASNREEATSPRQEIVYGIRASPPLTELATPPPERDMPRLREAEEEHTEAMYFPYRSLPILSFGWQYNVVLYILGVCVFVAMIFTASIGLTAQLFTIGINGNFGRVSPSLQIADVSDRNMTTSRTGFFWLRGSQDEVNRLLLWNFILRMVPTAITNVVISRSIVFDRFHLYTQPLVEMYNGPSSAEKTILLDYLTLSPLAVVLQAWNHRHWKVLYFAILSMLGPAVQLVPAGILLLTSKDDVIYGSFSRAFVISAIVILGIYFGSYLFAYLSIKRRFPRWGTSLIDIWAMCFSSHLARYPEFSECGPGWTKKDLAASLQLRYDEFSLGLCRGTDGVARVGFDTASTGREQKPTQFVSYVDTKRKKPIATAHCCRCLVKPKFHESDDALKKSQLLKRHYRDHIPPIECERGPRMPK